MKWKLMCAVFGVLAALLAFVVPVGAAPPGADVSGQPVTQEALAAIAGAILSLAFGYIPGLKDWYGRQQSEIKAAIMAGLVILVAAALFGMSCLAPIALPFAVACTNQGAWDLFVTVVFVLMGNQGAYALAVRPYQT